MSLGMSYPDYWDGDCCMVRYYRQMNDIRIERSNSEMWLQAAYIYEALLDASPVFNPLSRKNKPFPFRSEPFPLNTGNKQSEERKKKQRLEDGKEAMRRMMDAINKRFIKNKEKGGEVDDGS